MSDLTTGRISATPADLQQPLPAVETGRPVVDRETLRVALDAIQALADALDRTQANFVTAVNGRPVRDMCETLAENHAAALKGARLMPMPSTLMRQP